MYELALEVDGGFFDARRHDLRKRTWRSACRQAGSSSFATSLPAASIGQHRKLSLAKSMSRPEAFDDCIAESELCNGKQEH